MKNQKQTPLQIVFFVVVQYSVMASLIAQAKNKVREGGATGSQLSPAKASADAIDLRGNTRFESFSFKLPHDAFGFRLKIAEAEADLDLFVKKGAPIEDFASADFSSESDDNNESLTVTRMSESELAAGTYYVDVAYQSPNTPFAGDARMREIPFTITYEIIYPELIETLGGGRGTKATLTPEKGMYALFKFDVPADSDRLRIDIFDTTADLDILANYENPLFSERDADYVRVSPLGRESLVVDQSSHKPLAGGTIYIMVFDQGASDYPCDFSIFATLDDGPPGALLSIPEIPVPPDPLSKAVSATVQITDGAGSGSGCLVSEQGHILTNWHTVENSKGVASEEIVVAVTFSIDLPPVELFKAEVLQHDPDHDLALLKITGGMYGQDLPAGYRFPHFQLSKSPPLKLGQPISVIGFPGVGGSGSRTSVSMTRGILSGFETYSRGRLLKTDAEISGGNSGGAAVDPSYQLIGLPSSAIAIEDDKMGFIEPISQMPPGWLEIIGGGG